tara:strand:+ start:38062 stop:38805 length:744 start_codon:yes stop_codon:yes gene_type:complete
VSAVEIGLTVMVKQSEIGDKIEIETRYANILERLRSAEVRFGRPPGSVCLLAVSKNQSCNAVRAINKMGQIHFGENQLQDALPKIYEFSKSRIIWHFIGAIQTNKCKDIAINFDWVHSIERFKTARRLSAFRPDKLKPLNILLQVNLQNEPTKSGVNPNDIKELTKKVTELPNLNMSGLMTIPRPNSDFAQQRLVFRELREIQTELSRSLKLNLPHLSMGMTDDLEAAVAEGATHIRIGTGIFGPRQ